MVNVVKERPQKVENENWHIRDRSCLKQVQVILFEIDCEFFLHKLFCQFTSWTNWINSSKFMDNCWISCQVMADMEKFYNDLIIINLYLVQLIPTTNFTKYELNLTNLGRCQELFIFDINSYIGIFWCNLTLIENVYPQIVNKQIFIKLESIK